MSHNAVGGNDLSTMYFAYQYDALGNVTQETQTGVGTTGYSYDAQSQLTQASRGSGSYIWNYAYDTYGNLRSWDYRIANLVQESATYTYGNTEWLDLLTGISVTKNGTTYTGSYAYDTSGNPTSYYNVGDLNTWTLRWKNGRERHRLTKAERNRHKNRLFGRKAGFWHNTELQSNDEIV